MKILALSMTVSLALILYGWSQSISMNEKMMASDSSDNRRYEKISIEDILDQEEDAELIKLSGEIIKKLQCSTYLFRDETGEIRVQIDNDSIPDRGLLFNEPMTINGEIEPASHGKPVRVDADTVRYFF